MRSGTLLFGALVLALAGCDGTAPPPTVPDAASVLPDASVDRAASVSAPAAPDIPWASDGPPVAPTTFEPCPGGWDPGGLAEAPTCVPASDAPTLRCDPGLVRFLDSPTCEPAGDPCPADGDWPTGLPADASVVYVRAGAAGGDGTEGAPFGTIGAAVAAAPDGAVVAVAEGVYPEAVELSRGLRLWGVCAARTVLSPGGGDGAAIRVRGVATVRNVQVRGTGRVGLRVDGADADATVSGLWVEDVRAHGVLVDSGARADLSEAYVVDTRPDAAGRFGWGVAYRSGASGAVQGVVLERATGVGLLVEAADVALDQVGVFDTAARPDGTLGRGLTLQGGARADVSAVYVDGSAEHGALVTGEGSTLRGEHLVAGRSGAAGLSVERDATTELEGLSVQGNGAAGLRLVDGASATLADVVVAGTGFDVPGGEAIGLDVSAGSTLAVERIVLVANGGRALVARDATTTVDLSDARHVLRAGWERRPGLDVRGAADVVVRRAALRGFGAYALRVRDGAIASLDDAAIEAGHGLEENRVAIDVGADGIVEGRRLVIDGYATGARSGGELELTDARLTRGVAVGEHPGVAVHLVGGSATLRRVAAPTFQGTSLRAWGAEAVVEDASFGDRLTTTRGPGVIFGAGARGELHRVAVSGAIGLGFVAQGEGTHVQAEDLTVTRILPPADGSFVPPPLDGGLDGGARDAAALDGGVRDGGAPFDAGPPVRDAGPPVRDAGPPVRDAGTAGRPRVGVAILVVGGATLEGARWRVEDAQGVGIAVRGDGSVLRGADLSSVLTVPIDRFEGAGVAVVEGGSMEAERLRIAFPFGGSGVLAWGSAARLEATELRAQEDCPTVCPRSDGGVGVGAYDGANVTVDGFLLIGGAPCGVQVARGGTADLSRGWAEGFRYGACAPAEGFSLGRLNDGVTWIRHDAVVTRDPQPAPVLPTLPTAE